MALDRGKKNPEQSNDCLDIPPFGTSELENGLSGYGPAVWPGNHSKAKNSFVKAIKNESISRLADLEIDVIYPEVPCGRVRSTDSNVAFAIEKSSRPCEFFAIELHLTVEVPSVLAALK